MAMVKSFSTAAGKDEPIAREMVDDADDESCAEESAMCANKTVGETEHHVAADETENNVAADVKSCADETANVD